MLHLGDQGAEADIDVGKCGRKKTRLATLFPEDEKVPD